MENDGVAEMCHYPSSFNLILCKSCYRAAQWPGDTFYDLLQFHSAAMSVIQLFRGTGGKRQVTIGERRVLSSSDRWSQTSIQPL